MVSRQGRRERPIDPEDGPVEAFAWRLRQLRKECGNPTYKEMKRYAQYSPSALSSAASGQTPPSLEVTLAYVRACLMYAKAKTDRLDAAINEWTAIRQGLEAELNPIPAPDHDSAREADTSASPPSHGSVEATGSAPEADTPTSSPSADIAAPTGENHPQSSQSAPASRRFKVRSRRGRLALAILVVLIMLGLGVRIATNLARPGSAEAGSGSESSPPQDGHAETNTSEAPGLEKGTLGEDSRCSAPFPGPELVVWRVCARVEKDRVSFALKITNQGLAAATIKTRLEYVQATKFHPCPKAPSARPLDVPAGETVITDPEECAVSREEVPFAYQGVGWVLAQDANASSYKLSPTANVHPDRVTWQPDLA
ncbi:hypothetical protein PUR34_11565 [Streptomyces sp. JV185]|uniref:hypothetical protein n=1 Tax=Streptomyces sp. JV185 TaxID=858638 RepID=UPI002E79EADA|nr:hypothetical protein [Streptomyces sp. JV185]MEE1768781.1 hypothetical protein [Streptomyces sp. JV185]